MCLDSIVDYIVNIVLSKRSADNSDIKYIVALNCAFIRCGFCIGCSLSKDIFSLKANIGQSVPLCPHSAEILRA